jgi:glycosyltransferase involved in cell wall biosynthesis
MSITVTVGIVARNEEGFIEETLQSIIKQDFPEGYEILVVDGNSQDQTRELAHKVLESSSISYKILNEKDFGSYGLCFARNLVVDHSHPKSQYIAYTDADCIVAEDWLSILYQAVKDSGESVAGAGGPRRVGPTNNRKELVINRLITSYIGMAGNPAFSVRDLKFIDSIPNYNAIYKKDLLAQFRYDDHLGVSDDNEINFRFQKEGYTFIYVPQAKVYHRETSSMVQFSRNMYHYGYNITNTLKKHKRLVRSFIPLPILFFIYLILLIPLYWMIGWLIILPLILYFLFATAVFLEVLTKTRSIYSLLVYILLPLQHLSYAVGVLYNFIS